MYIPRRPPPYVPPEYRKCKYSEMPEPYRTEIDNWIQSTQRHMKQSKNNALIGLMLSLSIVIPLLIALIIVLIKA